MLLYLWLLGAISFGPASMIAAGQRNRPKVVWYWNGFILQPLAMGILLALPHLERHKDRTTSDA